MKILHEDFAIVDIVALFNSINLIYFLLWVV